MTNDLDTHKVVLHDRHMRTLIYDKAGTYLSRVLLSEYL